MKTLESLLSSWRAAKAHTYASENADLYRGFDNGLKHCADQLSPFVRADREMRQWILNKAEHLNHSCYLPPGEDGHVRLGECTCGLSALRKSLEESNNERS